MPSSTSLSIPFVLFFLLFSLPINKAGIYTPDSYPDSQTDFERCGLSHAGFACDPDELLNPGVNGTKGVELLDQALQYIRNNTECVCDRDKPSTDDPQAQSPNSPGPVPFGRGIWMAQCEKEPNQHGFTVSVVVLGKMEVTDEHRRRYRSGAHVPAIFAAELKNKQKRGQCNDDILIVLAINDSSIRTSTGGMATNLLSSPFILNASHIAQKFFARRDFTAGLLFMADQFAFKLGAQPRPSWFDIHFWPLFPEIWRQSAWRWPILIVILLLIMLLILAIVFLVLRLRKPRNSAEYTPGRQTGRTTKA